MSRFDELRYRINGDPVTGRTLIREAESISEAFANDWLKQTSVAAQVLREAGHTVDENPDFTEASPIDTKSEALCPTNPAHGGKIVQDDGSYEGEESLA